MKRIVLLSAVILLTFAVITTAYGAGVPQKVLDASQSVVYIEAESSTAIFSGSGFIVKNDSSGTYIATNNHVIKDNPKGVFVWTDEDEKRSATVLESSEQYDLAIIKLSEPIEGAALALSAEAKQGDEVYAVGFPVAANYLTGNEAHLSSEVTITNGIVSSVKSTKNVDYGPDVQLLQINADINAGNSGGPLINAEGKVVGINTYGVMDSQGIFGAISAAELIEFIENNNILELSSAHADFPVWIPLAGAGVIVIALLAVFIPRLIKKRGKAAKELKLNEYLSALTKPLDEHTAVSLLMPVILKLRDNHNNGTVHLKLSPSRVVVKKDGFQLIESNDIPTDEFLAPEQRTGGYAGIKADIYGVCALLRHILGYYQKTHAEAEYEAENAEDVLYSIMEKGLSEKAEDRYASMQELLFELSPYNTGIAQEDLAPFSSGSEIQPAKQGNDDTVMEEAIKPKKKKKLALILSIVGAFIIIIGVFGYFALNYFNAVNCAAAYEFAEAGESLGHVPFAADIFPEDFAYIEAGMNMEVRNYDKAMSVLQKLDGDDASELLKEVKYRKAAKFANENEFDSAIAVYTEIKGYKDATKLTVDTKFRKASYLIDNQKFEEAQTVIDTLISNNYEGSRNKQKELYYCWGSDLGSNGNYLDAYDKLKKAEDYLDTKTKINELRDIIYSTAIDMYHAGKYTEVINWFSNINDYQNSETYIILCKAQLNQFVTYESLESLIGFEDASEIILRNYYRYVSDFLTGLWKGDDKFFKMEMGGNIQYTLPGVKYGNYYKIENGIIMNYKEQTPNITKNEFSIKIINKDCIQVFAYKNGRTYILYRQ